MTRCTVIRYEQLEISPETIEQELRPAVCERRQTDRLKENYSIDLPLLTYICLMFLGMSKYESPSYMCTLLDIQCGQSVNRQLVYSFMCRLDSSVDYI